MRFLGGGKFVRFVVPPLGGGERVTLEALHLKGETRSELSVFRPFNAVLLRDRAADGFEPRSKLLVQLLSLLRQLGRQILLLRQVLV